MTHGASWFNPKGGTGGRGGNGGTYSPPNSSQGGVPTGGAVPDAGPIPDAEPALDAKGFDGVTGGTTTPVTRYGGIFPG